MHSPSSEIEIRAATVADLAMIRDIYAEAVLNGVASYETDPPDLMEMTARYEAITARPYPYLVAAAGAVVCGYAYASAFRTRPAYRFMVEDSIYLDPRFQGRGIGKLLLESLIRECTAMGFRQMVAVIGGAHPASIALHRALGFEDSGRIRGSGFKFGRWLDTAIMQLPLGEGETSEP
ncbi:MAG: N-acetyltransferase family protein [Nitratireductor sp.]